MADSIFIKTVAFGGYDKEDVEKRLKILQTQLYESQNELREYKSIIDEQKNGADPESAEQTALETERTLLTEAQSQNDTLTQQLKEAQNSAQASSALADKLSGEIEELKAQLKNANSELENYRSGKDPAALSRVFIEAQKSSDMLIEDAKKQSEQIEKNVRALAESVIAEANASAANIVYEAEKKAAEINANAQNESEQMKVASENMKAVMLDDVKSISADITKVKELLENISKTAVSKLSNSENLLSSTEKKLCSGGIPTFREPQLIQPDIPAPPVSEAPNSDLEKLLAMANSLES